LYVECLQQWKHRLNCIQSVQSKAEPSHILQTCL
jgi:hypothetical protein